MNNYHKKPKKKMTTILLLHFATDYTGNSALEQCKLSSLPFGWDDPVTSKDVSFIVQAIFQMVRK